MISPERENEIDEICTLLREVWKKYPMLRLCQLVYVLSKSTELCPSLFYRPDADILRELYEPT